MPPGPPMLLPWKNPVPNPPCPSPPPPPPPPFTPPARKLYPAEKKMRAGPVHMHTHGGHKCGGAGSQGAVKHGVKTYPTPWSRPCSHAKGRGTTFTTETQRQTAPYDDRASCHSSRTHESPRPPLRAPNPRKIQKRGPPDVCFMETYLHETPDESQSTTDACDRRGDGGSGDGGARRSERGGAVQRSTRRRPRRR